MWLDSTSQGLVREFWERSDEPEPYPRDLARPLALALPVALVSLPRLNIRDIERWLHRRSIHYSFGTDNRQLRGCLVAYSGQGIIFIDGADPADESRFTVAHEIGHFLRDYWQARRETIAKYGPEILDVLDGIRPPTVAERIFAVLGGTRVTVHADLMDRNHDFEDMNSEVWRIERMADRIALELLAPHDVVLDRANLSSRTYADRVDSASELLQAYFGLPLAISRAYGSTLLAMAGQGPSWLEGLGLR